MTRVTAADLAAIPLFAALPDADRDELAAWFDVQDVSPGVRLTGEGAAGYSFFVMAEGSAVVTSDGTEIAGLGPGDFFGEIAIIGNGRRSATVTTTTPARILVMFGTEFRRLQQAQPEIAARIEAAMADRVISG
jgi:voltage-gated potassium channel